MEKEENSQSEWEIGVNGRDWYALDDYTKTWLAYAHRPGKVI